MRFHGTILAFMASALLTGSVAAQQSGVPALDIRVRGGGFSGLTDFNDAGTADTRLGFNAGGGVGVQLTRYVALRSDFTFARNERRMNGVDQDNHLNRYFYTAAVQLQYPTSSGLMPYILAGAGGVTTHQEYTDGIDKTKVAGIGGIGLSYRIPGSRFAVFTEGLGYLYKLEDFRGDLAGFDKTQFDLAWSAGVSYTIGL